MKRKFCGIPGSIDVTGEPYSSPKKTENEGMAKRKSIGHRRRQAGASRRYQISTIHDDRFSCSRGLSEDLKAKWEMREKNIWYREAASPKLIDWSCWMGRSERFEKNNREKWKQKIWTPGNARDEFGKSFLSLLLFGTSAVVFLIFFSVDFSFNFFFSWFFFLNWIVGLSISEFLSNSEIEKKKKFYVNLYCVKRFILNIKYCFSTKTSQNENEIETRRNKSQGRRASEGAPGKRGGAGQARILLKINNKRIRLLCKNK